MEGTFHRSVQWTLNCSHIGRPHREMKCSDRFNLLPLQQTQWLLPAQLKSVLPCLIFFLPLCLLAGLQRFFCCCCFVFLQNNVMWTKTLGFEMGRGRKESETICCFLGFLMQDRAWQRHALGCGSMSNEKGPQHPFPILRIFCKHCSDADC